MSVLILVRHGQASLFAADYDQLSPVGEEQARLLGQYWARQRTVIDEVYCGPRTRQQKTAELAGEAYPSAGLDWPTPTVLEELDEYDLDGLVNHFAPGLAGRSPEFAGLVGAYLHSAGEPDQVRNFQRMFESLIAHWQAADEVDAGVECWPAFRRRVTAAVQQIQAKTGRGKRVAVFTSGGLISCVLQLALGVTNQKTQELNWRIRNCSLTEFVFTPDRFTLDSFNQLPHLEDSRFWTYR